MPNLIKTVTLTTSLFLCAQVFAATVPVVNLNGSASDGDTTTGYGDASSAPSNLSTDQRLSIIERQIANLNQQNTSGKIADLQTQVQQLQGKVDELAHQNQALADQMKQQYQDLNARLTPTAPEATAAPAPVATPAVPAAKKVKAKSKEAAADASTAVVSDSAPSDDPAAENAAYQKGFALLKKGDYVRAAPAFENFLKTYPNGAHAANAHFWLGEIHLAQNQSDAAASEYRRVISDFPNSDKVPMAQLKLGIAYHDQNDLCKAKATFEKVVKLYPKSPAADLAKKALIDIPSPCSGKKA